MVRESDLDLGNAFGRSIRTFAHRLARQGICSFFASADRSRCGRGGCCRFWHSSRLRLPACIDLDRIPWGPVSRAGHASGWPSQARAWHAYGHPDGGLNRERQPSHRRSGALRRNVRPHSGRHPCARRCGAPTTWSTPSAGVPAVARQDRAALFDTFADLRGASIGVGPEGSGTAYLMRQLFEDSDLRELDVRLSHHELPEQAQLVAQRETRSCCLRDAGKRGISTHRHSPARLGYRLAAGPPRPHCPLPVADVSALSQLVVTTWCALFLQRTNKLHSLEPWLSPVHVLSGPTALRFSCCSERSCRGLSAPILQAPRALQRF